MSSKDLHSLVKVLRCVDPAVYAGNITGSIMDTRLGRALEVVVSVGAIAAVGNMTLKLQESDDSGMAGAADVVAGDLLGAFPAALVTDTSISVGYRGSKRYVQVIGTLNSGTSVAVGATGVLGELDTRPPE